MFRKPKRKIKGLRRQSSDDEVESAAASDRPQAQDGEEEESGTTSELLAEARKRVKATTGTTLNKQSTKVATSNTGKGAALLHTYETSKEKPVTAKDLVTSTAEHHPAALLTGAAKASATGSQQPAPPPDDGIFRDTKPNKFHAGPIRAAASVRVTARFDYQPDICKDYKETGHCGFGDTCIYLHDRGDTLTGWQLEQQWEQEQKLKREQQQQEMQDFASGKKPAAANGTAAAAMEDDGLPFACHLCREYFKHPVATTCGHYFCEACIMKHVRNESENCPVCGKDTGSVFNQPTKLLAKKRRVLGSKASKAEDSWEQYSKEFSSG